MELSPRPVQPQRSDDQVRDRSPRELPEARLDVVEGGKGSEHSAVLHQVRERASALLYALTWRLDQFTKAESWAERAQQWLEQYLLRVEVSRRSVETARIRANNLLQQVIDHGATSSVEQLQKLLEEIEASHIHAIGKLEAPDVARAPLPTARFANFLDEFEYHPERQPLTSVEVAGAICPKHQPPKPLGEYGQDGARMHRESGVVIQWDGNSSYDESQTAAEIGAAVIDDILSGLPDTSDDELIGKYVDQRWHEITLSIEQALPHGQQGSFVFTAIRALPEPGRVVVLKVGDSEVVAETATHVRELLPNSDAERDSTDGIFAVYKKEANGVKDTDRRTYRVQTPRLDLVRVEPGSTITFYQASDGVFANTGKHLREHVRKGTIDMTAPLPSEEDDVIIVKTTFQF